MKTHIAGLFFLFGIVGMGISTGFARVDPIPAPLIHQRIFRFEALEISGTTPAGGFSAKINLQLNGQAMLSTLSVNSSVKGAFKDLAKAGIHINESLRIESLVRGSSMIEVKDLNYNGTKIPISGTLLHAKYTASTTEEGGQLKLTYKQNMITGSESSIIVQIKSKLLEIEGSEPVAYSRFWYIADEKGEPIDELKVVSNEWDIPFIGKTPVGVDSIELGYVASLDNSIKAFQAQEKEMIERQRAIAKVENLETIIRYLKMSMAYYDRVLSDLPANSPSRQGFIEGRERSKEMLSQYEEELRNRSRN